MASYHGHIDIVRLLLDRGADINQSGGYFGGALRAASYNGEIEVVRLLLDRGADINQNYGGFQSSALRTARSRGHSNLVDLLISQGATDNAGSLEEMSTRETRLNKDSSSVDENCSEPKPVTIQKTE